MQTESNMVGMISRRMRIPDRLSIIANDVREWLRRREDDDWIAGEWLSEARTLCASPDCGLPGRAPDNRYHEWIKREFRSAESADLTARRLHEIRIVWERFGERPEARKLPKSVLVLLAAPQHADNAMAALEKLSQPREKPPTIKEAKAALSSTANSYRMRWTDLITERYGLKTQTLRNHKARYERELKQVIPAVFTDEAEAEAFAARFADLMPTDALGTVAEEAKQAVPETARVLFEKKLKIAIDAELANVRRAADLEIERRVAEREQRLTEESREVEAMRQMLIDQQKDVTAYMTEAEYKLVLGCLHPDRPDRTHEQLAKAFAIFKRLEKYIRKYPVSVLRERGWSAR